MTVNSKPIEASFAIEGSKIFHDMSMKIDHVSDILSQKSSKSFYRLSWKDTNQTSISVSCQKDCVVIVVLWEDRTLQDILINDLKNKGWISKSEESMGWWKGYGGNVPRLEKDNYGGSKAVLSKRNTAGNTISFIKPENHLPLSIFVINGNVKIITNKVTFHISYNLFSLQGVDKTLF